MAHTLVVHGHFYQPPRENPWTEELSRETSAGPFHDWNDRIDAESYRPNGVARVFDDRGRVVDIVNNYSNFSFNIGPTLLSWLQVHDVETYERMLEADAVGGGGIAQGWGHIILPLANDRDLRTQVRWGLADFAHRFGRVAEGMWLPEGAVDERVLAVLVEEGVRFTILAPGQARRVRPLGVENGAWTEVDGQVDTSRPYRWVHPSDHNRGVDIVFYEGDLSHAIAFELGSLSSRTLLERVGSRPNGLVTIAADGETFGHHHRWGERLAAHALSVEAPEQSVLVTNIAAYLRSVRPDTEVEVSLGSWSCAHGVGRWQEDCGCSTGGPEEWNQRWRTPLRAALDGLRDRLGEIFERRGRAVLIDPWVARDAYLDVFLRMVGHENFAARHVRGDPVVAFTLLEAQRNAMAMYTSCGWFFNDIAGLETIQILRYAARVMDLLGELGEDSGEEVFLDVLDKAESNVPKEGTGRDVWLRHIVPARVDASREVANVALFEFFQPPTSGPQGSFVVETIDYMCSRRDGLALVTGRMIVTHRRTGRCSEHLCAALHSDGLQVRGSIRPAGTDAAADEVALASARQAFEQGAPESELAQLLIEGFGPHQFNVMTALPVLAEHILDSGLLARLLEAAVDRAVGTDPEAPSGIEEALSLLQIAGVFGVTEPWERAQETIFAALRRSPLPPKGSLRALAKALGVATDEEELADST